MQLRNHISTELLQASCKGFAFHLLHNPTCRKMPIHKESPLKMTEQVENDARCCCMLQITLVKLCDSISSSSRFETFGCKTAKLGTEDCVMLLMGLLM